MQPACSAQIPLHCGIPRASFSIAASIPVCLLPSDWKSLVLRSS